MLFPNSCIAALFFAASALTHQTLLNGDVINGVPVITKLDLRHVPSNAITRYYFKAGEAQGTVNYYVPVFVARGTKESLETGKRLSLSSTVHGDEYNGVRVVQRVFADMEHHVKAGKLNGTVIGIPTVNVDGIMHNQRNCMFYYRTYILNFTPINQPPSFLLFRKWIFHQLKPYFPRQRFHRPSPRCNLSPRLCVQYLERHMGKHLQRRRSSRSS